MRHCTLFGCLLFIAFSSTSTAYQVLDAINFGGDPEVDSNGIHYRADNLTYAKHRRQEYVVAGVPQQDQQIYQSIIFNNTRITLDMPLNGSGHYLLVFKLYDEGLLIYPFHRTLNVRINGHHDVISKLVVESKVGKSVAYDEQVYFCVCGDQLLYRNQKSKLGQTNRLRIMMTPELQYTDIIVSALVMVKGDVENFPVLPSSAHSNDSEMSKIFQQLVHKCNDTINLSGKNQNGTVNIFLTNSTVGVLNILDAKAVGCKPYLKPVGVSDLLDFQD